MILLAIGLVSAAGPLDKVDAKPTLFNGQQMKIQSGEQLMLESGKTVRFSGEGAQLKLHAGESSAECEDCNLTQTQNRIHTMMSNGQNAEIKIMPDTASERALERLQLKNCSGVCDLELKEVGTGDNTRMAYEVKAQKNARFLGIFPATMNVEAQIDAETGEVIRSKKSWWAFLASESDEAIAE